MTCCSQVSPKLWYSHIEAVLGPQGQGAHVLVSIRPQSTAPLDNTPAASALLAHCPHWPGSGMGTDRSPD